MTIFGLYNIIQVLSIKKNLVVIVVVFFVFNFFETDSLQINLETIIVHSHFFNDLALDRNLTAKIIMNYLSLY